jgi:putative flavoprotein involved in K+ transport
MIFKTIFLLLYRQKVINDSVVLFLWTERIIYVINRNDYFYHFGGRNMTDVHKRKNVIIIGAGPAGIGVALALAEMGIENFLIVEQGKIGQSFRKWPKEMKFITPSFPGQGFGALDLNAIVPNTSPAYSFQKEHVNGEEYAMYLQAVAEHFEVPVECGVKVKSLEKTNDGFLIHTGKGVYQSSFVIWAAGEFQYPNKTPFVGAELCLHNSEVKSWNELGGEEYVIIGGYESGMDAAYHLIQAGKQVTVLSREATWDEEEVDPSLSLSPYTVERVKQALETERLQLLDGEDVCKVDKVNKGYAIYTVEGNVFHTKQRPILATGFRSSLSLVADCFYWKDEKVVELTEKDESSKVEGLFLVGPQVKHNQVIFCFIYKFRQRFAIVAEEIARRLGVEVDQDIIENYRRNQMYLQDLSCCEVKCEC